MDFKIIRNKFGVAQPKPGRVSWPWKDMDVGDQVVIPPQYSNRGQVGCHVYGRGTRKKFTTKMQSDNSLIVTRIA